MSAGITESVGNGASNRPPDVRRVQRLLAPYAKLAGLPPIEEDGLMGGITITAIERFQAVVLGFPAPDGRVDPGGQTWAALIGWADEADRIRVTYGFGVEAKARLVSDYGLAVIDKALGMAGMKAAVITSTLRLPREQAATMYKNAVRDLGAQFALYGSAGDEVLRIYAANRGRPAETVIGLMREAIEAQLAKGRHVSRHVTTPARYAKLNVIDIGLHSTRAAAGASFHPERLTKPFAKLAGEGYIATFIDETAKSNCCWHLEIAPGAKKL